MRLIEFCIVLLLFLALFSIGVGVQIEREELAEEQEVEEEQFAPPVIIAEGTQPIVAIHLSNATREDWKWRGVDNIKYFETYTSVESILDQHKIPYVEISDDDIASGKLFVDGEVKYPIVLSFSNYVVPLDTALGLKEYVKSGGHVFFNAHSLMNVVGGLRDRGKDCFLFQEMKLRCQEKQYDYILMNTVEKQQNHSYVQDLPDNPLAWKMSRNDMRLVTAVDSDIVLSTGSRRGWETIHMSATPYGEGSFIFLNQVRPFWGRYEGEPARYTARMLLYVLEEAFAQHELPLVTLHPWNEHQAAFTLRIDVEPDRTGFVNVWPQFVDVVEEHNVPGVFYVLVDQAQKGVPEGFETYRLLDPEIKGLVKDAHDRGIIIGAHSTWHIGPDFDPVLRMHNIKYSLQAVMSVTGVKNNLWVAPAFGANKDTSLSLIEDLGITSTGDQKIGMLPHFALSPAKAKRTYSFLEIPTSDFIHKHFYFGEAIQTSLEHHTKKSVKALVDQYYAEGGLINLYGHLEQENVPKLRVLMESVKEKDNVWYVTPDDLVAHWKERENIHIEDIKTGIGGTSLTLKNDNNHSVTVVLKSQQKKTSHVLPSTNSQLIYLN